MAGLTFRLGQLPDALQTDASNNVGIGGSPSGSYKLEVTGTSRVSGNLVTGGYALIGTTASTGVGASRLQVTGAATAQLLVSNTTSSGHIALYTTGVDAYITKNTASGTMYFGLAPQDGSTFTSHLSIASTGAATFSSSVFSLRSSIGTGTSDDADIALNVSAPSGVGKYIMFGRNSSNTAVMALSSAGALSLSGSGTTGVDLSNSTFSYSIDIGNNQFIRQKNNAGTLCLLLGMSSDNSVYLRGSQHIVLQPAGGTTVLTAFNSGNVSIGTGDIGYKLNLNGQPGANGYTLWTNYSDSRLKENVTDLDATNVLDKICAIRPVTYNYNELSGFDEDTRARRISGFIAQELMEVFPDMVGTIKKDDVEYYDTNLSNLTLYLVKAIQELSAQNQDLKSRLDKAGL